MLKRLFVFGKGKHARFSQLKLGAGRRNEDVLPAHKTQAAEQEVSIWMKVWQMLVAACHRLVFQMRRDRTPKQVVPILITATKKLERQQQSSSKRVHFKLRRTQQRQVFRPLDPSSKTVQNWLVFMILPLAFDIFAFGLRIAFCDIFLRHLMEVYYMDLVCDALKVADAIVTCVTVVPRNTYPKQAHSVTNLQQIAFLYLRYQFPYVFGPLFVYQLTSFVLLLLPHNDYHLANCEAYLYVWWVSMLPRFVSHIRRLLKYSSDSVVDPQITHNVKQFQFGVLVMYIISFAHLIGCFYYFLARLHKFDKTTWIQAFADALPPYHYESSPIAEEYLLVIFKGFCRGQFCLDAAAC